MRPLERHVAESGQRTHERRWAASGALELEWDNGKQVGIGTVIGNVLVVASSIHGRTAIWIMNLNPDGSLSGKWSRRTDRGAQGRETWTRIAG